AEDLSPPDIAITTTTAITAIAAPPTSTIVSPRLSPPRLPMPVPNVAIGSNGALRSRLRCASNSGSRVSGGSGTGALLEPAARFGGGPNAPIPFAVAAGAAAPACPDSHPFAVDTSEDRSGAGPVIVGDA